MKKIVFFAAIVLLVCMLCSCGNVAGTETDGTEINYRDLYTEDGLYSEENFICNAALPKPGGVTLVGNGKTDYRIVYRETDDETLLQAINDLQAYFTAVCGGIELAFDTTPETEKEIVIGSTSREFETPTLVKNGAYIIDISSPKVYIYGRTSSGVTNGIYGFCEDYLGCVFFDRDTTYVPPVTTVVLPSGRDVQEPAFDARDVGDSEVRGSKVFAQRLRVRQDESFDSDDCHHSLRLIPKEILAEHPEYYAEINGQRRTDTYSFQGPQLCFSNEEVIDLLEAAIVKKAEQHTSDQTVWWDISQQDSMNYCHCEKCAQLTEETDNPAAPIFRCINIIAKRHPELKFSTLAYHYGSAPPKNFTFEENVMIKWCIMSSYGKNDYSAPLTEGASTIAIRQRNEILGWSELVENLYVWDYITNYFNYLLPFPCLDAMPGNIRLLRDCGVDGILTLSCYNSRGAGDRFKANFAAHLLWNPDFDEEAFFIKYFTLYYGKESAPAVMAMYRLMQEKVCAPLWVYNFATDHRKDYLSEENVTEYFALLDEAFAKTDDEVYLKRLRFERLCLLYAAIANGYGDMETEKVAFVELCEEFSIKRLSETGLKVADFLG